MALTPANQVKANEISVAGDFVSLSFVLFFRSLPLFFFFLTLPTSLVVDKGAGTFLEGFQFASSLCLNCSLKMDFINSRIMAGKK